MQCVAKMFSRSPFLLQCSWNLWCQPPRKLQGQSAKQKAHGRSVRLGQAPEIYATRLKTATKSSRSAQGKRGIYADDDWLEPDADEVITGAVRRLWGSSASAGKQGRTRTNIGTLAKNSSLKRKTGSRLGEFQQPARDLSDVTVRSEAKQRVIGFGNRLKRIAGYVTKLSMQTG